MIRALEVFLLVSGIATVAFVMMGLNLADRRDRAAQAERAGLL